VAQLSTLGGVTHKQFTNAMQITKSILCLWFGSSAFACFAACGLADYRGALSVIAMEKLDLGGGQSFAVAFPVGAALVVALVCAIVAIVSLMISWRLNKQRLFSWPHAAALLFLLPLVLALLCAIIIAA
jgi:hypothetical protein